MKKAMTIMAILVCASFAQAQSPQQRIEVLQSQTLQMMTQRLNDQQRVINRLDAEQRRLQELYGTSPYYPQPTRPTPPPVYVSPSYPKPTTYYSPVPKVVIDGIEVTTQEELLVLGLLYLFDAMERKQQGLAPARPEITVYSPTATTTPAPTTIPIAPTTPPTAPKPVAPELGRSLGSQAVSVPPTPRPVTDDGLTRTLGRQTVSVPQTPPPVTDDGLIKR